MAISLFCNHFLIPDETVPPTFSVALKRITFSFQNNLQIGQIINSKNDHEIIGVEKSGVQSQVKIVEYIVTEGRRETLSVGDRPTPT